MSAGKNVENRMDVPSSFTGQPVNNKENVIYIGVALKLILQILLKPKVLKHTPK